MAQNNPINKLRNETFGWAFVAVAAMMWGSDLLLRPKVLSTGMGSVAIVMFEHIALAVIFAPTLIKSWRTWTKMSGREFACLLFIAWGGSGLATVLLTQAYSVGEPITATLLQKLQPAFAISLAAPILRERPKWMFFAFFGFGLIGAYLMSFGLTWMTEPMSSKALVAAGLAVGAAAIWGSCTVVGRWSLHRLDPFTVAGLRFTLALPMLLVWNLMRPGTTEAKFAVTSAAFLPLLAIVILPDALGMALYYFGLRKTTASLASLAELAYPATAILLAYPTTRDFTIWKWIGIAILVGSLHMIRRGNFVQAPLPSTN